MAAGPLPAIHHAPASLMPLPLVKADMCDAAVTAALMAYQNGVRLQKIELSLQRTSEGLEMASWAGGIREQFTVALPMVERFLSGLKQANPPHSNPTTH